MTWINIKTNEQREHRPQETMFGGRAVFSATVSLHELHLNGWRELPAQNTNKESNLQQG